MKRLLATGIAGLVLTPTVFADSTVKSYQEARQVLDAGIQAMGGLEAALAVKAPN